MKCYLKLLKELVKAQESGNYHKEDRTGTGTTSIFGGQIRHDLQKGFPLLTTKKLHWKSIAYELLWFLKGSDNVKFLQKNGVSIWNEWAKPNGDVGRIYGVQWRRWEGFFRLKKTASDKPKPLWVSETDQIKEAIHLLKTEPNSRRIVVSAWNVSDLDNMALPPCHVLFQFVVTEGNKLNCHVYQRSVDIFLGLCYNIASYALLTHIIAQITNLIPAELIISFGDLHLYDNHVEQAKLQLERKPYKLPELVFNNLNLDIDNIQFSDFSIVNYKAHPHIKAEVAV